MRTIRIFLQHRRGSSASSVKSLKKSVTVIEKDGPRSLRGIIPSWSRNWSMKRIWWWLSPIPVTSNAVLSVITVCRDVVVRSLWMSTKDEDFVETMFVASTHDYLLFFTDRGQIFRKKVFELLRRIYRPWKGGGQPAAPGRWESLYLSQCPRKGRTSTFLCVQKKESVRKSPCWTARRSESRACVEFHWWRWFIDFAQLTTGRHELFATQRNGAPCSWICISGNGPTGPRRNRDPHETGDRVVSAIALSGAGTLLTVTEGGFEPPPKIILFQKPGEPSIWAEWSGSSCSGSGRRPSALYYHPTR